MLARFRQTLELIRFSHTLFALPFALLAALMAWTADRSQRRRRGCFAGRSWGYSSAWSRRAARRWRSTAWPTGGSTRANPRTASGTSRGDVERSLCGVFAALCSAGFVASTLLFLPNRLPLYLSVPVLAFLLGTAIRSGSRRCRIFGWGRR